MIYFTSDTHFCHDRDFIWGHRGFKSCAEANEAIINNWNSTVNADDEVYMLGDFFFGNDIDYIESTLNKLNGKIHLIIGNHDTETKLNMIYRKHPEKIVSIDYATLVKYNKISIYCSHYPTVTVDPKYARFGKSVINAFGHTHDDNKFYVDDAGNTNQYMYNVALDAHNNQLVSIETLINDVRNYK